MFSPLSSDQELRTEDPEHFRRLAVDAPLTAQAGVNWFYRTREGLVKWPRLVVLV